MSVQGQRGPWSESNDNASFSNKITLGPGRAETFGLDLRADEPGRSEFEASIGYRELYDKDNFGPLTYVVVLRAWTVQPQLVPRDCSGHTFLQQIQFDMERLKFSEFSMQRCITSPVVNALLIVSAKVANESPESIVWEEWFAEDIKLNLGGLKSYPMSNMSGIFAASGDVRLESGQVDGGHWEFAVPLDSPVNEVAIESRRFPDKEYSLNTTVPLYGLDRLSSNFRRLAGIAATLVGSVTFFGLYLRWQRWWRVESKIRIVFAILFAFAPALTVASATFAVASATNIFLFSEFGGVGEWPSSIAAFGAVAGTVTLLKTGLGRWAHEPAPVSLRNSDRNVRIGGLKMMLLTPFVFACAAVTVGWLA